MRHERVRKCERQIKKEREERKRYWGLHREKEAVEGRTGDGGRGGVKAKERERAREIENEGETGGGENERERERGRGSFFCNNCKTRLSYWPVITAFHLKTTE